MAATASKPPGALTEELANTILEAIKRVGDEVSSLRKTVESHGDEIVVLRKAVHGSNPPPADPPVAGVTPRGRAPSMPEIATVASGAASDVDALRREVAEVRSELVKQSDAMGIGMRPLKWLASKDGRNTVVRLATLVGAAYTALHAAGVLR